MLYLEVLLSAHPAESLFVLYGNCIRQLLPPKYREDPTLITKPPFVTDVIWEYILKGISDENDIRYMINILECACHKPPIKSLDKLLRQKKRSRLRRWSRFHDPNSLKKKYSSFTVLTNKNPNLNSFGGSSIFHTIGDELRKQIFSS